MSDEADTLVDSAVVASAEDDGGDKKSAPVSKENGASTTVGEPMEEEDTISSRVNDEGSADSPERMDADRESTGTANDEESEAATTVEEESADSAQLHHSKTNNNNNHNNHSSKHNYSNSIGDREVNKPDEDQCGGDDEGGDEEEDAESKNMGFTRKRSSAGNLNGGSGGSFSSSGGNNGKRPRRQSTGQKDKSDLRPGSDRFCWRCHRECRLGGVGGGVLHCAACPRVFHQRCSSGGQPTVGPASPATATTANADDVAAAPTTTAGSSSSASSTHSSSVVCADCSQALALETALASRPDADERLGQLADALGRLCDTMSALPKSMPFREPVSTDVAPDYAAFVCHPTDLASLRTRALQRDFSSVEAFLAEAKWLLHNCIVYNGSQAPISAAAKQLMQTIKREAASLEQCPTCYLYGERKFASLCPTAHPLVWARLRHWPQWPGKVVARRPDGSVEIVFFGTHDRAILPSTCVTFHSGEAAAKSQISSGGDQQLELALKELAAHIKNLQSRYGDALQLPAPDTPYSESLAEQLFTNLRPKNASSSAASGNSLASSSNKRPRRSSKASVGGLDQLLPARPSSRGSSSVSCLSPAVEAKSTESPGATTNNANCTESAASTAADAGTATATTTAAAFVAAALQHSVSKEAAAIPSVNSLSSASASTTVTSAITSSVSGIGTASSGSASTDPWLEQMRAMAVRSFAQALEHSLAQLTRGGPVQQAATVAGASTNSVDGCLEIANSLQPPPAPPPLQQQQQQQQQVSAGSDKELTVLKQKLLILSRQHAADRAKLVFRHQLQVHEMEHNHRLAMCEQRAAFDIEKQKVLSDAVHSLEAELKRKIDDTKKKQWCAFCRKEAFFYCCWNTSYCDTACQQKHWPQHMATCTQARAAVVPPVAAVTPSSLSAAAAVAAAAAAAASSSASSVSGGGGGSAHYRQLIGR